MSRKSVNGEFRERNRLKRGRKFSEMQKKAIFDRLKARKERRKEEVANPELKAQRLERNRKQETIETKSQHMVDDTKLELLTNLESNYESYFNDKIEPKMAITTSKKHTLNTLKFIDELQWCFPNSEYVERRGNYSIKQIAEFCHNRKYTDLCIVNEDHKHPNALTLVHLPDGPTFYFSLTSVQLAKEISNHGTMTSHRPELLLNRFHTPLGMALSRHLQTLFPQQPQIEGRQVVTVHCQRDYLFFRRHRYVFKENSCHSKETSLEGKESSQKSKEKLKVNLQELGPRFTLKLRWAQTGVYDTSQNADVFKENPGLESQDRKRFFL